MASTADLKALYDQHLDARKMVAMYLSPTSEYHVDSFIQAIPHVHNFFSSGAVDGGTLLEMSFAPLVHCFLPASNHFTDTYFACPSEKAIKEVHMWVKNEPGCLDVTDVVKGVVDLLGSSVENLFGVTLGGTSVPLLGSLLGSVTQTVTSVTSVVLNEIQGLFRSQVKNVLLCNFMRSDPVAPTVLPPVDCLALSYSLELFAVDEKSFCDALKNVTPLLKKGGHLVMFACLEGTFFKVGDVRFPAFCLKQDFLTETLIEHGYTIKESHIFERKTRGSYDVFDFKSYIILKATKERDI
ncbi:indolethylamine N-methyltransferase-like [Pleurodeles waltl]